MDLSHIEQQQRQVGGGLRTAGSDKHNQPQQYIAKGCVTDARRMGGSVVSLCSVHAISCLPGTCLVCAFMSKKQTTNSRYVRTRFKIRLLVLKPGKSSCPLPPKLNFQRSPRAPECMHGSRPDLDQRVRPGFLRRPLSVSPKSARPKRYVRKSTKKSQTYLYMLVYAW